MRTCGAIWVSSLDLLRPDLAVLVNIQMLEEVLGVGGHFLGRQNIVVIGVGVREPGDQPVLVLDAAEHRLAHRAHECASGTRGGWRSGGLCGSEHENGKDHGDVLSAFDWRPAGVRRRGYLRTSAATLGMRPRHELRRSQGFKSARLKSALPGTVQQLEAVERGLPELGGRNGAVEIGVGGGDRLRHVDQRVSRRALELIVGTVAAAVVLARTAVFLIGA